MRTRRQCRYLQRLLKTLQVFLYAGLKIADRIICFASSPEATDFYPASGCRAGYSGVLLYASTSGYAWSSSSESASGVYGSKLYFYDIRMNPESYNSRADGFPVRCVQE